MREIIIIRKKRFMASLASPAIMIDGVAAAKIKNGATVKLTADENAHEIFARSATGAGNVLRIEAGSENIVFYLNFDMNASRFYLVPETLGNAQNPEIQSVTVVPPQPAPPKSQKPSYVSGIVISLILLAVCAFVYSIGETSVIGFLIGSVFSAASAVVMIIGGFWFFIIPLPFIYVWKAGCNKPNQSTKRKVFLGTLAFVLPVLVFVALFALRHI